LRWSVSVGGTDEVIPPLEGAEPQHSIPAMDRKPAKETAMKVPSRTASRAHHIICPFCESGELISLGHDFARCDSCGLPLLGSALETLRDMIGLPDALGSHPCECGHPEMRELPYRVLHCPACGSEVLPIQSASDVEKARLGSV
jgi:Zn finger protein HypA/HybF involved in hydrogenase expression